MKCWRHIVITLTIIALFLIFSQTAYASINVGIFGQAAHVCYIDPGTGSIIIQVLIGLVVGGLAMIGIFWRRVKDFLGSLFSGRKGDDDRK